MANGRKTGGRKKGSVNRKTRELQAKVEAEGITPLDYMLTLLRDAKAEQVVRLDAAKAAAPYVHPRLTAVELSGNPDQPIVTEIRETIVDPNA